MTLASLNTVMPWPGLASRMVGGSAPGVVAGPTVAGAGQYQSWTFCARESMAITHVGWRTGTATGSPKAEARIETVDATGLPSGTLWGTNTNIVTGVLTGSTFALQALTAAANVVAGQLVCVKVLYNAGTSFVVSDISNYGASLVLPYYVANTGTPTKSPARQNTPLFALGSSSTTFYHINGVVPAPTFTANTFNNTSSARRGLRFQVPFKCRVVGLRWWDANSTGDYNALMLDDAGSELSSSSTAFDGDHNAALTTGALDIFFDNPVTLSPGTWYRAALEPTTATNIAIGTFTLPSASYRSALPGGSNHHYTTYVASSWTDTATDQVPLLDVLIDQLDDGWSGIPRSRLQLGH